MRRESSSETVRDGLLWVPVDGDSMWPSLKAGDLAGVAPLEGALLPGSVVLARLTESLVVHRVVKGDAAPFILRGDNTAAPDAPLSRGRIVGMVTHVRRGSKLLSRERWDVGPRLTGRMRLWLKRRLACMAGGFA